MDRIGITGSSGFVGANLMKYFQPTSFNFNRITRSHLNDIENHEIVYKAIIHLAGKAHDLKKTVNSEEYYQINFELTKKLYDAFLKSDAKTFIFISSVKAVTDALEGVLTEDITPNPLTHYGKSKLMAEEYIRNQILPDGKFYYILRPCMIHGPGNKGNLNLLYNVVKKGIPYPLGAFDNLRSFLSVANLCFVIQEILSRPSIPSGVYNVSDDDALSTNQVIKIISEANGSKPRLWHINQNLIKAIARLGDRLCLPFNLERLTKLTENYVVSNEKIKKRLNIAQLPVSSTQGMVSTIRSFISN